MDADFDKIRRVEGCQDDGEAQVCDARGRVSAIIEVPDSDGMSNVFFGGPGLLTDWDKVYRRQAARRGIGEHRRWLPDCKKRFE